MKPHRKVFPPASQINQLSDSASSSSKPFSVREFGSLLKTKDLALQADSAAACPPAADSSPSVASPSVASPFVALASDDSTTIVIPALSRGSTSSTSALPPDFSRHARRCSVCAHPDRDAIEGDFIRWMCPAEIAEIYNIRDRASIYRHAHSTGLFAWRKRELARVLEGILESAEALPLESSDIVIRAARIYSRLDENGRWSEPPRVNFVFTGTAPRQVARLFGEQAHPRVRRKAASNRNRPPFKKSPKSKKSKEKKNF